MAKRIKAVVLAAGQSTRMKSATSKVLHSILGKTIINYLLDSLTECGIAEQDIVIVAGANRTALSAAVPHKVTYAIQHEQLGTAHALLAAAEHLAEYDGDLLVVVGDNPYTTADAMRKLIDRHRQTRAHCTFISAVFPGNPPPYGRIIRDGQGQVLGIVEERDASAGQRQIREVNASIYLFDSPTVFPLLSRISNENVKKEYYLTDIIAILRREKLRVEAVQTDDCDIAIGINDRWELQEAERKFNRQNQKKLALEDGVTILQPETVTIEHGVAIGRDTVIFPCTYLAAGTRIGSNCIIGPFVYLKNVRIEDGAKVIFEKREA